MSDQNEPRLKYEAAKLIIEVRAGVIPRTAMPEYTRRWAITSREYETMNDRAELGKPLDQRSAAWHEARDQWLRAHGESREYQATLENPSQFNWCERTWLWL